MIRIYPFPLSSQCDSFCLYNKLDGVGNECKQFKMVVRNKLYCVFSIEELGL